MQLLRWIVLVALLIVIPEQCVGDPSPIVIIPGILGSQLKVMNNIPNTNFGSRFCDTGDSFKELWISPWRMIAHNYCAKEELSLIYDPTTNSFDDTEHVNIKVPGFGDTSSVEYLNPGLLKDTIEYFHDMVEYFVDRGYKRGKTIRAAPYDWRLAADELEKRGYFHQLKSMIEDMYSSSNHTKVTLVAHSMGGLVSLHFLTGFIEVDQSWKDKYIHAYVSLNGAWSGSVSALQTVISSADDIPDFLFLASDLIADFIVPVVRTFQSLPWLFPKSSVFGNQVLISTPAKDYTANDYEELFGKVGYTNGYRFFQGMQDINPNYPAPNVPTFCFYSNKVPTPLIFAYSKDFDGHTSTIGLKAEVTNENGDGTVNIESARVCHKWSSMSSRFPFRYKVFDHVKHMEIVKNSNVLVEIEKIIGAPEQKS